LAFSCAAFSDSSMIRFSCDRSVEAGRREVSVCSSLAPRSQYDEAYLLLELVDRQRLLELLHVDLLHLDEVEDVAERREREVLTGGDCGWGSG
jgi:hypothetical protein